MEIAWSSGTCPRLIYAPARDLPLRRVRARPGASRIAGAGRGVRALEPQVFALLALLVENRDRLVSRDEILEKIWDGRSSRTRPSRAASSRCGRRWATTASRSDSSARSMARVFASSPTCGPCRAARRLPRSLARLRRRRPPHGPPTHLSKLAKPSIAVLPFRLVGDAGPYAAIAEALPDELIVDLARLHWLFVTARGSSFRLRAADADMADIGRLLGVRYVLAGSVEVRGRNFSVSVELADTRDAGIVWAERFGGALADVHRIRDEIRSSVLAALEMRIPQHEAALARLNVSEDLDAWSAYHLGLQHVYRFNRQDNAAATALFQRAIERDPALRARARGAVLRPFPVRVHAPHGRPCGRGRPRAPLRGTGGRARRDGSVRELRDGPHALAAGRPRRRTALAGARNDPQPQLRAGHLRARLDRDACRARRSRGAATSTSRCAFRRSIRSTTGCSAPAPSRT